MSYLLQKGVIFTHIDGLLDLLKSMDLLGLEQHISGLRHFPQLRKPMGSRQHCLTGSRLTVYAHRGRGTMTVAGLQLRKLFVQYISNHTAFMRISERTFRFRAVSQNKGKQLLGCVTCRRLMLAWGLCCTLVLTTYSLRRVVFRNVSNGLQ